MKITDEAAKERERLELEATENQRRLDEQKKREEEEARLLRERLLAQEDAEEVIEAPKDVQWTDSPALARKRKDEPLRPKGHRRQSSGEELDEDGEREWESPDVGGPAADGGKKMGFMPVMIERRRGSHILADDEKADFKRSLTDMVNLRKQVVTASRDSKVLRADVEELTPEQKAAQEKAQQEKEERVERLRIQLEEVRGGGAHVWGVFYCWAYIPSGAPCSQHPALHGPS